MGKFLIGTSLTSGYYNKIWQVRGELKNIEEVFSEDKEKYLSIQY